MTATITDPILFFSVMVAATLAAPILSEKLHIPDMVLLLLAGAVMGPHGLGWLERNSAIMLFASMGLVYIMFLAGLEIDLHRFISARQRSIVFGLLTFLIPQCVGTLLGVYVLSMSWPAAMLMASMFASHTLLAYPVASGLGIVRTEPVAITIGATIITDTLALLVLAVIAESARGAELTVGFWLSIVVGITLLSALSLIVVPKVSRWFFRNAGEDSNAPFLFVIGVVCVISFLSHYAQVEPIIGAFLAGIAFNRLIPEQSTLMNRVEFVGKALFIPFFLISVGMLVNLGAVVRDPQSWLVAGTMVCGVIVTKYAASHMTTYIFGYTRSEGNVMFGLSVVQAAATLAAAMVGYEVGVIDESVLNGAIGMIMVTVPLGSWAVDRYGRHMVSETIGVEEPRRLDQRILVPIANKKSATRLLDLSFILRETSSPSTIHPLVVVPDEGENSPALANGENLIAACVAHAASMEVTVNPAVRIEMNASDGIIRAAKELHADTVILGWGDDSRVAGRIFGSVRKKMLQDCPARLLFARIVFPVNITRRLLLPLPPQSERRSDIRALVVESKRLARQLGADLCVYVCDPDAAPRLRDLIEDTPPEMPVTIHEKPDWPAVRQQLFDDIHPDDTALLPVERRRGAFWTPSLDRLPDVMAQQFPNVNIIAAYPAFVGAYQPTEYEYSNVPGFGAIVPVNLDEAEQIDDALRLLVGGVAHLGAEARHRIHASLSESIHGFPVDMASGVVLLHARCADIDAITLLVGMGNKEWEVPGLDVPQKTFLALLSPKNDSPENHLAALAGIARAFHDKSVVSKITTMTSAEAIAAVLKDSLASETNTG